MAKLIKLPEIPDAERNQRIDELLALIEQLLQENLQQKETIQQLRDEIAVLKGDKARPKFKAGGMAQNTDQNTDQDCQTAGESVPDKEDGKDGKAPDKRAGSPKAHKTKDLTIHEELKVPPDRVLPPGSRFKSYRDVVVQDLEIRPCNTRFRLAVWQNSGLREMTQDQWRHP